MAAAASSIPAEIYAKWLGIAAENCPPNHYVLLGLKLYESNQKKIKQAADKRTKIVRPRCLKDREKGTFLLNQIATARVCLTDVKRKREYDAALRSAASQPKPAISSDTIHSDTDTRVVLETQPQVEVEPVDAEVVESEKVQAGALPPRRVPKPTAPAADPVVVINKPRAKRGVPLAAIAMLAVVGLLSTCFVAGVWRLLASTSSNISSKSDGEVPNTPQVVETYHDAVPSNDRDNVVIPPPPPPPPPPLHWGLAPLVSMQVQVGQTYQQQLSFVRGNDDPVRFYVAGDSPVGVEIDAQEGTLSWTPTLEHAGQTHEITVEAIKRSEGFERAQRVVAIEVPLPTLNLQAVPASVDLAVGEERVIKPQIANADLFAGQLRFSLEGHLSEMRIDQTSGRFIWTPTLSNAKHKYSTTIVVQDTAGLELSARQQVTFQVGEPFLEFTRPTEKYIARVGEQLTITLPLRPVMKQHEYVCDVEGPIEFDVNRGDHEITWTPKLSDSGQSYEATVVVSDKLSLNLTDTLSLKIDVEELQCPPPETLTLWPRRGHIRYVYYKGAFPRPDDPRVPVLLLHDWDGRSDEFDGLAKHLQALDFAVIVPQLLGSGDEGDRPADQGWKDEYADRMKRELNDVNQILLEKHRAKEFNADALCIVGAGKAGSLLAMKWADNDPAVRALVMLSPAYEFGGLKTEEATHKNVKVDDLLVMIMVGAEHVRSKALAFRVNKRLASARKSEVNLHWHELETEKQSADLLSDKMHDEKPRIAEFLQSHVADKKYFWQGRPLRKATRIFD